MNLKIKPERFSFVSHQFFSFFIQYINFIVLLLLMLLLLLWLYMLLFMASNISRKQFKTFVNLTLKFFQNVTYKYGRRPRIWFVFSSLSFFLSILFHCSLHPSSGHFDSVNVNRKTGTSCYKSNTQPPQLKCIKNSLEFCSFTIQNSFKCTQAGTGVRALVKKKLSFIVSVVKQVVPSPPQQPTNRETHNKTKEKIYIKLLNAEARTKCWEKTTQNNNNIQLYITK